MKIRTETLTDAALDWAVADADGILGHITIDDSLTHPLIVSGVQSYGPSFIWAQGGPIIEREGINLDNYEKNPRWSAWTPAPDRESGESQAYGPTPLIAAMRCFVQSRLGDEVEIPEELHAVG